MDIRPGYSHTVSFFTVTTNDLEPFNATGTSHSVLGDLEIAGLTRAEPQAE